MRIYWLKIQNNDRCCTEFGVTAHNWEDAMLLVAKAGRAALDMTVDVTIVESYREIKSIDELDQSHVVPNMGSVLRRGVWFPNLPDIQ